VRIAPSANDLSIRQLQYIVAVADTLGFHKAAAQCHVSQPTLSTQVQQIESVLGVAIFERSRHRVLLTGAGEEIVARARRILVELDDLLVVAARARDPFAGVLRIGIIPTIAPYLLPEITPAIAARYPKLRIFFREEKTADIVRELAEGRVDAGILALEAEIGECARAEIAKDPFVVALPIGHPLTRKKRLTLGDLEDTEVLLLDDTHCFRTQALAICSRAGAHETAFRATSLVTLAQMVSSGAGVTLLPSMAVPVENRRGQFEVRPFVPPVPSRTVALVWRPGSPLAPALEDLALCMRGATPLKSARCTPVP
jgi:LysR family hydrogen peroxide-inducible transcriptional activator